MKPLDPVSSSLFPSLAAYARKVYRRELLALVLIILSAYIIGRDALSAYQGRVATENMMAMVPRVNDLEVQSQKECPRKFVITKAQVSDAIWKREREKERTP